MLDARTDYDARYWHILPQMLSLDADIAAIPGIAKTDYDVTDYGDPLFGNVRQVVLIPKYDIPDTLPVDQYFKARREQKRTIIDVCANHGLHPSGDPIEDMGEHWYIVMDCDSSWPR